jgi:tetratricopeptide (TPR) repeat protein
MTGSDAAAPERFDELWDFDDPAGTEARFRELLPRARQDKSLSLQIRTQIARTLGLQKKWDEARSMLDGVEAELPSSPDVVRVRWLLERGRVLNSSGDRERARPLFREAWELARAAGEDGFAVDAAHMVAIVEEGEAIAWNERALELARRSPDPRARRWRGSLLNNLGWAHHGRGDYEQALALFEEALAAREEQGDRSAVRIARWCVARAKRSLGRTEESLAAQEELLRELEAAGGRDGYVLEEIAECLLALGREEDARPFFAAAWEELSRDAWLPDAEPDRLARLEKLGRTGGLPGSRRRE